ncbi:hypothetical protein KCP70_14050 [Salmonella enterica subsp. enterica]|nr:hypothetical protein KCP70_14050 [Salmonella enterica subsp. enterica]
MTDAMTGIGLPNKWDDCSARVINLVLALEQSLDGRSGKSDKHSIWHNRLGTVRINQ